ncbi:MAG: response regulator transcription factor [Anaerolineae bacterium]|nr:response regulator transcription factor [Anaerolineae bacterium]
MAKILLVEDEHNLSNVIRTHLEEQGHTVKQVFDGLAALDAVASITPDLIILDIMLPGIDGLEVCRRVRETSIVPILMLTARVEEIDRVLGLESGADDYVTKPFSMYELKARVRALLRRMEMMQPATAALAEPAVFTEAGVTLDPASYEATLDGQLLDLTPKEFALLYLLLRYPGRVFSRAYLLDEIWDYAPESYDRTVDTHVYRLRQKLGVECEVAQRIVAVRGVGYKFERG